MCRVQEITEENIQNIINTMKAICNLLVAMVLFFAVPSNASADNQGQYKDVYATIQPGTNLNMRQGPGKNNLVVEKI